MTQSRTDREALRSNARVELRRRVIHDAQRAFLAALAAVSSNALLDGR